MGGGRAPRAQGRGRVVELAMSSHLVMCVAAGEIPTPLPIIARACMPHLVCVWNACTTDRVHQPLSGFRSFKCLAACFHTG